MGEGRIFRTRGVGGSEERTDTTSVFPFCPTGIDTTPISDEAMFDKACMLSTKSDVIVLYSLTFGTYATLIRLSSFNCIPTAPILFESS
jgi:hypothetical protein